METEGEVLGALARAAGIRLPTRGPAGVISPRPPLTAQNLAQPDRARLRSYMGFGFVTWAIADGADKVIIVEPQESFRGERLIIDFSLTGVTNSLVVLLRRIDIGTMPQSPSVELAAPAIMFARDSTNAELDLQIAFRGTKVQITLGLSSAPVGAAVVASVGMFGQWLR